MKARHPDSGNLEKGLDYLAKLIRARLEIHAGRAEEVSVPAPDLHLDHGYFARFLQRRQPDYREYVTVLMALAPHVDPAYFDALLKSYFKPGEHFPGIGGIRGKNHTGFLPTGETVQFVLAGGEIQARIGLRYLFSSEHWFAKEGVLRLLPPPPGEPTLAGQLVAEPEFLERVLTGRVAAPAFAPDFPARQLETSLEWDDLVLPERSHAELAYLRHYLEHHDLDADPDYGRYGRRGYRALFFGPPGTGKTLTASLLGTATGRPVYRVDLSMVVSKWIGETEKNLAALFDRAERKDWILFFDEADALFSKRGEVKESRDKYANQETSFLLQRVEHYDGLCILATNFRNNLDKAFTRRFEAVIPFPPPGPAERLLLWQKMLPVTPCPAPDVDARVLADVYDLSGAGIANAVRHAVYEAVAHGEENLHRGRLLQGIRREYEKEDRLFPG